jgi:predicted transcriptional regulator
MTMKDLNTTAIRYVKMHKILQKGPVTTRQLAKSVGCRPSTAARWVNALLEVEAVEFVGFAKTTQRGTKPWLYAWKP